MLAMLAPLGALLMVGPPMPVTATRAGAPSLRVQMPEAKAHVSFGANFAKRVVPAPLEKVLLLDAIALVGTLPEEVSKEASQYLGMYTKGILPSPSRDEARESKSAYERHAYYEQVGNPTKMIWWDGVAWLVGDKGDKGASSRRARGKICIDDQSASPEFGRSPFAQGNSDGLYVFLLGAPRNLDHQFQRAPVQSQVVIDMPEELEALEVDATSEPAAAAADVAAVEAPSTRDTRAQSHEQHDDALEVKHYTRSKKRASSAAPAASAQAEAPAAGRAGAQAPNAPSQSERGPYSGHSSPRSNLGSAPGQRGPRRVAERATGPPIRIASPRRDVSSPLPERRPTRVAERATGPLRDLSTIVSDAVSSAVKVGEGVAEKISSPRSSSRSSSRSTSPAAAAPTARPRPAAS